jgi:hypothetical protein
MTEKEIEKLKILKFHSDLEKCAKKNIQDIIMKPQSFARVPKEVMENVHLLATENSLEGCIKEKLEKLKYICEYILSTRSIRRIQQEEDADTYIYDKYSIYQKRLEYISELLKR